MQTFLPYPDFRKSLRCLDCKRLGKQRVEARQILKAISDPKNGWRNHPAVKMWTGYEKALTLYSNIAIEIWIRRGYKNTMELLFIPSPIIYPPWLENEEFHSSHRANLLRKDPDHYSQFGWTEEPKIGYFWPVK